MIIAFGAQDDESSGELGARGGMQSRPCKVNGTTIPVPVTNECLRLLGELSGVWVLRHDCLCKARLRSGASESHV